ncbi:hypothetical protein [Vibrio owensii]|uniref:hypothetical protein n=1 Tax=Vibrio owensii TaxID=696485 RepID=UPI0018F1EF5C|nr:hypothetical protein [Vibrio owensii]
MLNSHSQLLEHMTLTMDFIDLDEPSGFVTQFVSDEKIEVKGFTEKRINFGFDLTFSQLTKFMPHLKRCLSQSNFWPGALSNSLSLEIVVIDEKTNKIIDTCDTMTHADELACDLWRSKQIAAGITTIRVPAGMTKEALVNQQVERFNYF